MAACNFHIQSAFIKRALTRYGKLRREPAHAWNWIILCLLIAWGMIFIFKVHLSFYAIPLLNYDVMYDIARYHTLGYPVILISKALEILCNGHRNVL